MGTNRGSSLLPSKRFLLAFASLHAVVTWLMFLVVFGRGMSRFDSGAPPTVADAALESASTILLSPLATLAMQWDFAPAFFPGLLGYVPVVANSLLWAVASWWLIVALRKWRAARPPLGQ